jgi:hypothetical protein
MDLLTTYTHNSEQQEITAPPLTYTSHKPLQHLLSLLQPAILTSRSLATASTNGDSSASRAQVLSSKPPLQNSTQVKVKVKVKVKVTLRLTVSQSVSLGVGLMTRYFLLFDSYGLVFVGRPL